MKYLNRIFNLFFSYTIWNHFIFSFYCRLFMAWSSPSTSARLRDIFNFVRVMKYIVYSFTGCFITHTAMFGISSFSGKNLPSAKFRFWYLWIRKNIAFLNKTIWKKKLPCTIAIFPRMWTDELRVGAAVVFIVIFDFSFVSSSICTRCTFFFLVSLCLFAFQIWVCAFYTRFIANRGGSIIIYSKCTW